MISPDYVRTCQNLAGPVGALDSLLVPIVAGGRTAHGDSIMSTADLRERLAERLGDARVAIETAQHWLASQPQLQ